MWITKGVGAAAMVQCPNNEQPFKFAMLTYLLITHDGQAIMIYKIFYSLMMLLIPKIHRIVEWYEFVYYIQIPMLDHQQFRTTAYEKLPLINAWQHEIRNSAEKQGMYDIGRLFWVLDAYSLPII